MNKKSQTYSKPKPPLLRLRLTDEQRHEIANYVRKTGDAKLDISVSFEANMNEGTISPATFLVGNAI